MVCFLEGFSDTILKTVHFAKAKAKAKSIWVWDFGVTDSLKGSEQPQIEWI